MDCSTIEVKEEREIFIVATPLVPELIGEVVNVTLFTAVNRQGTTFLWPIRLPRADGRDSEWARSAREGAALAMTDWTRVKANTDLGAYELSKADGIIAEPEWPKATFLELVRIGFRGRLIESADDPVIKRLQGRA
jgi:hypothetical protein